ncbi:hypothetical protein OPV22_020613 [Ensete ventricosum]|uniref:Uncharacterized protein n=1 Tax=Ensete ventricosum TaxID=4639 RepID=A0AAV8PA31_ENSVE|nr:hypothetical protein OPV22_020613 [Ensete ventricosum]
MSSILGDILTETSALILKPTKAAASATAAPLLPASRDAPLDACEKKKPFAALVEIDCHWRRKLIKLYGMDGDASSGSIDSADLKPHHWGPVFSSLTSEIVKS